MKILRGSFNPRLPGGRRLSRPVPSRPARTCFNPRLPGGRRLAQRRAYSASLSVSIHAFRGEGDGYREALALTTDGVSIHAFRGEGDIDRRLDERDAVVSIHAFRGEGDAHPRRSGPVQRSFNPRLPGGRRQNVPLHAPHGMGFNPRLPGGRRPQYLGLLCPAPARYFSMTQIFRVALGAICPYIRFLRCC